MRISAVLVFVFTVAFSFSGAANAAPPETVRSQAKEFAKQITDITADLNSCRLTEAECQEDRAVCEARCPGGVASAAPVPTAKKAFRPQSDLTCVDPATKKADGTCACPEGWFPTIQTGRYVNTTKVFINCSITKQHFDELLGALEGKVNLICGGLNNEACADARAQIEGARAGKADPAVLRQIKLMLIELRAEVEVLKDRMSRLEDTACTKDGTNCPYPIVQTSGSSNEWAIGGGALYLWRLGGNAPPSTLGAFAQVGFTGWYATQRAFQLTGHIGFASSEYYSSAIAGATLDHVWSDASRNHRFQLGAMGLVEPGAAGNEASFVGGRIAYRVLFGDLYIEPSVGLGMSQAVYRTDAGDRSGITSDWGPTAISSISLGYAFGGAPPAPAAGTTSAEASSDASGELEAWSNEQAAAVAADEMARN